MRVELHRPQDQAWEGWLHDVPRDVYHTAGFHQYAEGSGEGTAFLAVVGDRSRGLAWPYLLRDVANVPELAGFDATDVTSVYGYPGPLAWGCQPGDEFLADAWRTLLDLWRGQRVVAVFTRFHPLLGNASLVAEFHGTADSDGDPGVTPLGPTVSIDCTLDDEAARADYDPKVRRVVDRSRADGVSTVEDVDWTRLPEFTRLYRDTMIHNNAAASFFFDDSDFARLRAALPEEAHLLITVRGDALVAAGILMEFGGIVQTYLSASDRSIHPSPKPLFYDDARSWARARGSSVFHLGGGRGSREDSLLDFKGRFSSRRHTFHIGRWVLDRRLYRALVEAPQAGSQAPHSNDDGFFPAYRREAPSANTN
jgi:Acetyltransferase (GNAT) domain